jgi:uncharacterized membrane protein
MRRFDDPKPPFASIDSNAGPRPEVDDMASAFRAAANLAITFCCLRLLWFNFAHLFSMSLLPFSTAWMANSELAPQPVAFYAAVFSLVNATYICLIWELIDRIPTDQVSLTVRKIMRVRSITTLCLFGVASVVALKYPLAGLGICICCLIAYLKPDPSVAAKPISPE